MCNGMVEYSRYSQSHETYSLLSILQPLYTPTLYITYRVPLTVTHFILLNYLQLTISLVSAKHTKPRALKFQVHAHTPYR